MAIDSNTKLLADLQPLIRSHAVYTLRVFQWVTGGRVEGNEKNWHVVGGITPTVTSGYRSLAKQQELYDRRASNPYPVNLPGDSSHNFGLGWDSDVPDQYMPAWVYVRRYLGWTVPDNDVVHAEIPNWRQYLVRLQLA